jgi:membrane-bound metal-dependent hydrolase YbcI (DUF457 family)
MNTYTHFLMTAGLREAIQQRGWKLHGTGALLGSIMPDMPLFALTFGYWGYRALFDPMLPGESPFGAQYDALYFGNPFWIMAHNFFHAPLMVALFAALGYYGMRSEKRWGPLLFWFALACGLHSLVDIITHHNDGPLLFFPFDWQLRLITPISYWDARHYGGIVSPLEHLFNLGIITYFFVAWIRRKLDKDRQMNGGQHSPVSPS